MNPRKIYIMWHCNEYWKLTDDIQEALLGSNYRLATLDDLNDWACVGGFFKDIVVEVKEGFYQWVEFDYINKYGDADFYGEYEEVR